jgi:hypothetical protein
MIHDVDGDSDGNDCNDDIIGREGDAGNDWHH